MLKKIIFKSVGRVAVEDNDIPILKEGEVRVKHLYSMISAGTEILCLTGAMGDIKNFEPGYTAVGEIIGGWEGTSFHEGQIVSCCGLHAGFQDYQKEYAEKVFFPVSEENAKRATFGQLGKVAFHGLHRVDFKQGQWVVVFGLGVVGNLAAQLAKLYSGGKVLGIDPFESRRKIAGQLGIQTLDPTDGNIVEAVKSITKNGADIILETSGHPDALNTAFKIASRNGQISLIAGHYGNRELDMKTDFQNKELTLVGARRVDLLTQPTFYDKWTVMEYMKQIYELIENGKIAIDPLITHCVSPDKAPEMYERLMNRDPGVFGVVFDWTEA